MFIRRNLQIGFLHALFLLAFLSTATGQPKNTVLQITFKNMVDSQTLQLGNAYHNSFGEEYTVRNFKYYISNISLDLVDGRKSNFKNVYLINQSDSNSLTIKLNTRENAFSNISFVIGVDSQYNVSGTQTGDLDPVKGMFWTWNSGYIIAKLEATSPVSTASNNNATYHIGGFKQGQQVSRFVTLQLSTGKISKEIVIEANVNKWFSGVHSLKIIDNAVCTTPGNLATQYADNYAKMFTVASVK